MKYTKFAWLTMLLALLTLPAAAADNGNHYGHYRHDCDHRCHPHVRYITNVVTVTLTNTIHVPVYETNVVNVVVTNIVEASLDDASANYTLEEKHVYRMYVWAGGKWRSWGTIRSSTNETVRIIVPGYLTRAEPLVWQVVDVTVGFPRVAVPAAEPIAEANRQFVAMNGHLFIVRR